MITAFIASITPLGMGVLFGRNTICPFTKKKLTLVTKNCKSVMLMVDVWPLKSVILGACITLVRRSPCAASMKRKT